MRKYLRVHRACQAIIVVTLIFFLTGCAAREYYTPVGATAFPTRPTESRFEPYRWPLAGRVAVPYGALEEGVTSKGVVVVSREGEAVVAASDGKVVFADEKFRGYGKTLILDHGQGFSTVYARLSEIGVRLGESVVRGQMIARVGRFSRGGTPRLYFEIRKNSKALDPMVFRSDFVES